MSGVVTVTSHKDVSSLTLVLAIRIHSVCEAWGHVRNSERESILEVAGYGVALPSVIHEVFGEFVSVDAGEIVLFLVVVNQKLSVSIAVEVNQRNVVSAENLVVVNCPGSNDSASKSRNSGHANCLVKKVCRENDDFIFILRESLKLEGDISEVSKRMLYPWLSSIETFHGILEPKKLSLTLFSIRACSDIVLAAVTIEVYPVAHMVEVTIFLC